MEKRYEIGGKTYIQRPLVLIQHKQIKNVLTGLEIAENFTVLDIIEVLEDRLPQALAVVLTEECMSLRDKNLAALADELQYTIQPETAFEVIEDFFICNPAASLLQKLAGVIANVRGLMRRTGSTKSVSTSQGETSPGETPSSGDTPSTSADPI